MNNTVEVHQNVLKMNKKSINFNYNIADILVLEHQVIVLLIIPKGCNEVDNIYSVGFDAKIQWRVQKKSVSRKKSKTPFVGVYMRDNLMIANDFCGVRYIIDPKNGDIIGRDSEINGRYW